jgi:hypothetical protein
MILNPSYYIQLVEDTVLGICHKLTSLVLRASFLTNQGERTIMTL